MRKAFIALAAVIAMAALVYAAAPVIGTVVAVDGNKVTVEFTKHDMKVGDKVKAENGGESGKFGGGGMQMKGC